MLLRIPSIKHLLLVSLAACANTAAAQACQPPITGCDVPELAAVDAILTAFLCDRDIPGATLAIMKDDVIVYERGFGHSDQARSIPMPHDAMMRIASVSKPLTAAAIRVLIEESPLTLDTYAFDLNQAGPGVLQLAPFPSLGDERLKEITIGHLLEHEGGWDRSIAGDLTFRDIAIADAMEIESPPGAANTIRYILGQPLQTAPGTEYIYSNIGYLVLGLIVEERSRMPVQDYIQSHVLDPIGVPDSEHQAGRTFAPDQNAREPYYHSPFVATNVFDPQGPLVPRPYGAYDVEARAPQGGQVTTTRTLVEFLNTRFISGPLIGLPLNDNLSKSWRRNHTGRNSGTEALARQRGDGIRYAVLINARSNNPDANTHALQIRLDLDQLFDAGQINWPIQPPTCTNPYDINNDGDLNFFDLVAMIQSLGPCADCQACPADLDNNCQVNFFDLAELLTAFR